jgi:hypothetical protein
MIAGLQSFSETLWDQTVTVFYDNQDLMLDENRRQLEDSLRPDGSDIMPEYGEVYAEYKGFVKPDLRDTGAFYESLTLEHNEESVWVTSTDWKWLYPIPPTWLPHHGVDESLQERYGEVLGVSKEFVSSAMVPLVLDAFIVNLRYALGNGAIK